MKRHSLAILYIILLCPIFIFSGHAQSRDTAIIKIRELYKNINADKTLKVIKLENEDFLGEQLPDNGAELAGFFKGKELLKTYVWIGLSYGVKQFEYYFNKEELFFVYEKEEDFPPRKDNSALDYSRLVLAFEGRYYIAQNTVIDKIIKGKRRFDVDGFNLTETIKDLKFDKKLLLDRLSKTK